MCCGLLADARELKGLGDLFSDLLWSEGAGIDGEARGRHVRCVEDAVGVELFEERHGRELAELLSRGAAHAALEFVERALELNEVDLATCLREGFDDVGDEGGADAVLGIEGEDEGGDLGCRGFFEDGEPDVFAKGDEGLGAEVEYGEQQVDNLVVMEEFEPRDGCEFFATVYLPVAGRP